MRRDLRADDHAALYHALRSAKQVWCCFVFDRAILDALPRADRRVEFIRDSLAGLDAALRALGLAHGIEGTGLIVRHGFALDEIPALAAQLGVQAVFANHDDEPAALARDTQVRGRLAGIGVALHTSKDHVIFERSEVLTGGGTPYGVFTPYKNAWLKKLDESYLKAYPVAHHASALAPCRWRWTSACRGWTRSTSRRPTCTRCACPAAARAPRSCWSNSSMNASTATTRHATSPPSRARAT
jgi:deoxyribodipyrimidine photo-lyase